MTIKELLEKYPNKEFGEINIKRRFSWQYSEDEEDKTEQAIDEGWEIYLNHSCDEWIIGSISDAKKFYKNLENAIKYCEEKLN